MARAPSKTTRPAAEKPARGSNLPAKQGSREVTNWEEELERQAQVATGMEKGAIVGRNFSFKGGQMSFDGAPVPGNKVAVIIAAAVIEKAYYVGRYDPDDPQPPVCFAFDTDPDALAPNPEHVADLQNEDCASCPWNVWGSSDVGKGKACKDVRRLALIPAGTIAKNGDINLVDDTKEIEKAELGFAKLPPTSLNGYAAFVRQVASTMKRPPHGVYALMECVPDSKNQFVITFEALDLVPGKLLGAVMARHEEALDAVQQPYNYPDPAEAGARPKASTNRGKAPAKAQARQTQSRVSKPAAGAKSRKY